MKRIKRKPTRHTHLKHKLPRLAQLKCKKGEMAMVIGSDTGWAGVIVEIVGLMHDIYPDHFHRSIKNVWVVAHDENIYLCRDCDLMPIRPDDLTQGQTDHVDGI